MASTSGNHRRAWYDWDHVMAGIIFFFEENDIDVFSGKRIHLGAWIYAAKMAGDISRIIIVNKTQQTLPCPDSDLSEYTVTDIIPKVNGNIVHVVCPWDDAKNKKPLWDFNHMVDWYIFGPANGWSSADNIDNGIYIPQSGRGALHSVHAASIVLSHRYKAITWQHQ